MRPYPALLLALALCPAMLWPALLAQADTNPHAISPDMLQDRQRAIQREQDRLEREAGGTALELRRGELIRDCQTRVGHKSLYPGQVSFDSVNIIEENRIYISGKVNFPDARGEPRPWRYECMLDKGKKAIETASVSKAQ
jgi:hypothetical protein